MFNFLRSCALAMMAVAVVTPVHAADKIRIANEGGIRDAWTLPSGAQLAVPAYPADYASQQAETCVGIGYMIHPDGHTSDFALLKAWSAQEPSKERDRFWGAFASAASAALSQWHFVPRTEVAVPKPVYTVATFIFASPDALESRERCAIPSLANQILELKGDSRARRRMASRGIFDQLDIDPTLEARNREQMRQSDAANRRYEREPTQPEQPPPPNPPAGG